MTPADPREQRVIILLPDISGYTKFMVENHLSAVHGQMVITSLIEALLREVDIPLQLQEIEGDAVFLYATASDDDQAAWADVVSQVQTKLLRFFDSFVDARVAVGEMTACKCAICTHADELELKVVVHSGRAVFHHIGSRQQVSGTDVILAHRLLKNSVPGNEYLLLSDSAYQQFGEGLGLDFQESEESYESLGTVKTHVHFLNEKIEEARESFLALEPEGEKAAIRAYLDYGLRSSGPAAWRQLLRPTSDASLLVRTGFLLAALLYVPIFLLWYPRQVAKKLVDRRSQLARARMQPE